MNKIIFLLISLLISTNLLAEDNLKFYIKKALKNNLQLNAERKNFEAAKQKGITKIICISVNDPNVMKAWGENQKVEGKIFMAADPYCNFTKSIGAEIDRTEKGLGIRSARYTMLVENNIVKKIKEETDTGACEISAAENFIKEI